MMIKRRDLLAAGGALLGGAALGVSTPMRSAQAHEYELGKLTIEHPWVRAPKDGETTAYFYAFIHNKGGADKLIAVKSPNVGKVTLHSDAKHTIAQGGIAIAADKTTTLSPEGPHVVLAEVKKINPVGWGMELVLVFEKAGEVTVDAAVDAPDAKHAHDAEAMQRWEKAHPEGGVTSPAGDAKEQGHHHDHHDHGDHKSMDMK
ncbi:copper chaperone PCu(A)C [Methylosinus sporium]|uniref:Copper chaperone PCu(A)C n=1 Tax=Methylosinus sporium TaxID=428 RepID=A0A549SDH5_METSR|nr:MULTISPECIES: copper chaperone PCu(A)C [Methylosinus]MBU3886899.1 copper chaperone PCu(A)C [Methylosinus sp. KRF6]TRL26532.1 copper chaperone PCu(A)C [Methylosinus sporium]